MILFSSSTNVFAGVGLELGGDEQLMVSFCFHFKLLELADEVSELETALC